MSLTFRASRRSGTLQAEEVDLRFRVLGFRDYLVTIWGFPKIRGTLSVLGSILGSPYFGKLPYHPEFGPLDVIYGFHFKV